MLFEVVACVLVDSERSVERSDVQTPARSRGRRPSSYALPNHAPVRPSFAESDGATRAAVSYPVRTSRP